MAASGVRGDLEAQIKALRIPPRTVDPEEIAVVESTEQATDAVTNIHETCGFQDITGRRISTVVTTLRETDARVPALLAALGEDATTPPGAPQGAQDRANGDAPGAGPAGDDLMNGPQLPDNAMSQDDVDALLASVD